MHFDGLFPQPDRLSVGVYRQRPVRRHLPVVDRLRQTGRVGGLGKMLGQFGGVFLQAGMVTGFECAGHLTVQAQAARAANLLVQRLAEQR
ncbi:MAG: hypothetical protein NTZ05_23380, partial [Chloroflexi bacterium]|nr:hypothetical protein [Chloroflexota bacterium]